MLNTTELDTFDMHAAAAFLRNKSEVRSKHIHEHFVQATAECSAIIQMLITNFSPHRIYQWGSLLDEKKFSEISDIDIAVEGVVGAESFFRMYAAAEKLTQFPLDLVDIATIDPLHAESIRKKGALVYEQNRSR